MQQMEDKEQRKRLEREATASEPAGRQMASMSEHRRDLLTTSEKERGP